MNSLFIFYWLNERDGELKSNEAKSEFKFTAFYYLTIKDFTNRVYQNFLLLNY